VARRDGGSATPPAAFGGSPPDRRTQRLFAFEGGEDELPSTRGEFVAGGHTLKQALLQTAVVCHRPMRVQDSEAPKETGIKAVLKVMRIWAVGNRMAESDAATGFLLKARQFSPP